MYAPVLNNIGPALISQGFSNAAQSTLQGAQSMANGISSAGSSIGGGLAALGEKNLADHAAKDKAIGGFTAMYNNAEAISKSTGIPVEQIQGIAQKGWSEKNGSKMAGNFLATQSFLENAYKTNIVNTQMAGQKDLKDATLNAGSYSRPPQSGAAAVPFAYGGGL